MSIDVNVGWIKCARKRCFPTRKHAADVAKGLKRDTGKALKPYSCEICGQWHLFTPKKAEDEPERSAPTRPVTKKRGMRVVAAQGMRFLDDDEGEFAL